MRAEGRATGARKRSSHATGADFAPSTLAFCNDRAEQLPIAGMLGEPLAIRGGLPMSWENNYGSIPPPAERPRAAPPRRSTSFAVTGLVLLILVLCALIVG